MCFGSARCSWQPQASCPLTTSISRGSMRTAARQTTSTPLTGLQTARPTLSRGWHSWAPRALACTALLIFTVHLQGVDRCAEALIIRRYAQRVIYQHQHPASCTGLRFLVYSACPNGIGSTIHVMGRALSHAMRLNRVLMVVEDPEHPYYDRQYCPPGTSVHDCYFEPVSNCSWADVAAAQGLATFNPHVVQQVKFPEDNGVQTPVIGLRCNTGAAPFPSMLLTVLHLPFVLGPGR